VQLLIRRSQTVKDGFRSAADDPVGGQRSVGTVVMIGWLVAVIAVVFALVRHFDPEARRRDG
jgi:hypothetical protein